MRPGELESERPSGLRPGLADWIDLLAAQERDEGRPVAELRQRDRAIGARLAHLGDRPAAKLVAWIRTLRDAESRAGGARTAEWVRLAGGGLAAAGLVFGAAAALGALSFQPRGRINVVAVLGVLVGLPSLFLLLALLNALPPRARAWLPWIGSEPEGGGLLQPARWALRALPPRARETLAQAWGRGRSWERLTAPVRRWLLLSASQGAAVAFNLGALATALGLVVFTDLSFGWSTTLEVDPADVHRVTTALSSPWAWAVPDARPSLELVERTRFFRIQDGRDPTVPLETYGGWWPFLALCVAVYGLLPRLIFFVVARAQLRRALGRAIVQAPGSARVLDRLDSPLVETTAADEPGARSAASSVGAAPDRAEPAGRPLPDRAVVVSWADALDGPDAGGPPCTPVARFEAGGQRSPDDDAGSVAAAAAAARGDGDHTGIVLVVRGFEPPLAEVFDFLRALRRALGPARPLLVLPLGGREPGLRAWRRRVGAEGDPWLAVAEARPTAPDRAEAPEAGSR